MLVTITEFGIIHGVRIPISENFMKMYLTRVLSDPLPFFFQRPPSGSRSGKHVIAEPV